MKATKEVVFTMEIVRQRAVGSGIYFQLQWNANTGK